MHLVRRLATVPPEQQLTTAITVGELIHGARRVGRPDLTERVEEILRRAQTVLPFDAAAGRRFGEVRADLEKRGETSGSPQLPSSANSSSSPGTSGTSGGSPGLSVENWI